MHPHMDDDEIDFFTHKKNHQCMQEARIQDLERQDAIMGVKIDNLITELNRLTNTLKSLIYISVPGIFAVFAFLFVEWVKK